MEIQRYSRTGGGIP